MYITRSCLIPDASKNEKFWSSLGTSYEVHRLVWTLFPVDPDKNRDFLYRQEENNRLPTFYVVSEREPEKQEEIWQTKSMSYNPLLCEGDRLSFILRVNPVVTKQDLDGSHHRHDVIMEAKTKLKEEGVPRDKWPSDTEIVQDEGFKWLEKKGQQNGFSIKKEFIRADGYMQQKFYKPNGKQLINISTIDFNGILTVTDPELLKKALFKGIGPAKGFGCGLMMVRRILA
ncbi:MAG: type I-E CRISPR-associated protein Cas6/Cse3/CasE [Methanosarcina barkeri]|nr:type I-E CRISPR-associated protein Cas6/Cse3/CasE [Methanosarcina sp. ERenArc_MAG2]